MMAPGGVIDWVPGQSCSFGNKAGTLLLVQKGLREGSEKRVAPASRALLVIKREPCSLYRKACVKVRRNAWRGTSSSVAVRDRGH